MHLSADSSEKTYVTVPVSDNTANSAWQEASRDSNSPQDGEPHQDRDLAGRIPDRQLLSARASWLKWYAALKNVLPIYIAVHLAIFATSCLAFLFTVQDFAWQSFPLHTLWQQWYHWDTSYFTSVAQHGYVQLRQTAFFPFYPLLERVFMVITHNPLLAGLFISNVAGLIMFVVLYRLVKEDFNGERGYHTVLYFSLFPAAFFFAAAYSESLFLCLSVLSFYHIRHGRWGLAGLFGFLASLTRPDGMFLLVVFCYEYLRRIRQEQGEPPRSILSGGQLIRLLKAIRSDSLFGLCFPAGIALFASYCYFQFHDPLAFVHAHAYWYRSLHFPGSGLLQSMWEISRRGLLSFLTLRNLIDLGADLLVLALIALSFIGPWKLPKHMWVYGIYAALLYIYFQLFPKGGGDYPLESISRFVLEIFPAFIMLARISKYRTLHLSYCMVSGAILFFLLTQFLTGHWVL